MFKIPYGDDLAKLLLRLMAGGLMLFHGVSKLTGGIDGIAGMLTAKGLPEAMAYGVYVGEVLAPLLLVVGLFTRLSAAVFAFNMVVAVGLAHAGELLSVGEHGGWAVELQAFYLFTALAIVLAGPGAFSIDGQRRRAGAKPE
ncbi:DoxX family protein [Botrimarina colliarenosi]|nr:DoxX family protein [Botrimarina colliarenosi]